ncbi:MAG: hypothetical protein HC820_03015 [Hydrococcus sp. RM1_1_31]|nr:hypothetical protein [Hydrococcus sp. RM1_1_31]
MNIKKFNDLATWKSFFLSTSPSDSHLCTKLGRDRYSCYGVIYQIAPDTDIYPMQIPARVSAKSQ